MGKKWKTITLLLVPIIIIKMYVANSQRVETAYSTSIFATVSSFFRRVTAIFPFSIGDILYGLLIGWLLFQLIKMMRFLFAKPNQAQVLQYTKNSLYRLITRGAALYIVFNLCWGINYNRKGIAWQMGLDKATYSTNELKLLNQMLLQKVNSSKAEWIQSGLSYPSEKVLFQQASAAYDSLQRTYSFLAYKPVSLKTSLWGWFGNYANFTGYYNPFTGEAQVNTTIPKFLLPFTSCHEIAHQLGYAKESEANFVGFLAAKASQQPLFTYSVYLDLFLYANKNLFLKDSIVAKSFQKQLVVPVLNDLQEWRTFNQQHQVFFEPIITWMYGKFLENNQQPRGILSYDEVTGFMIAYYRKFGEL